MKIGIDASNIRAGGGVTHLVELLNSIKISESDFEEVIVWANESVCQRINPQKELTLNNTKIFDYGLFIRILWQFFALPYLTRTNNISILFAPGGIFGSHKCPVVTMSQNLLPFEKKEMNRYFLSKVWLRLMLLRVIQKFSFKRANGLIFLSRYAQNVVIKSVNITGSKFMKIIPHGINARFFLEKNKFLDPSLKSQSFKIIYVSQIDKYKHQDVVIRALDLLRSDGYDIQLHLVGHVHYLSKKIFEDINIKYNKKKWIKHHGHVSYDKIQDYYNSSDIGIFASSCENLPNILIEMMASGLPIASSNMGPMPEVLGENAVYFNPENYLEIYKAVKNIIDDRALQALLSDGNISISKKYSWHQCANSTFDFLSEVAVNNLRMDEN